VTAAPQGLNAKSIFPEYENFRVSMVDYREVEVAANHSEVRDYDADTVLYWEWRGDLPSVVRLLDNERIPVKGFEKAKTLRKTGIMLLPVEDTTQRVCTQDLVWGNRYSFWREVITKWQEYLIGVDHGNRYFFASEAAPLLKEIDNELTAAKSRIYSNKFAISAIPETSGSPSR
ncbi:MAG: hypothetical protein V3S46_04315, partial [Nitrospinota bacterium]